MKYEYIAVDMDGTLLNNDHSIMPKTKDALIKLQEQGIKLIIATGRPLENIKRFADQLKMQEYGGYIIGNNGALVVDYKNNDVIFEELIDIDKAKNIFEALEKFELYPFYRDEKNMYVEDVFAAEVDSKSHLGHTNMFKLLSRIGNYKLVEVDSLKEFVSTPLYKIMAVGENEYINQNFEKIHEAVGYDINPMSTYPTVLEFAKSDISKANGLRKTGIDLEKTIAFGDSMNDYDMVEAAGLGVAMGNAMPKVKEVAQAITSSNNEEGIYEYLRSISLI